MIKGLYGGHFSKDGVGIYEIIKFGDEELSKGLEFIKTLSFKIGCFTFFLSDPEKEYSEYEKIMRGDDIPELTPPISLVEENQKIVIETGEFEDFKINILSEISEDEFKALKKEFGCGVYKMTMYQDF